MTDKKSGKGKDHPSNHKQHGHRPQRAANGGLAESTPESHAVQSVASAHEESGAESHASHAAAEQSERTAAAMADRVSPGELSQPEASEASQIPVAAPDVESLENSQATAGVASHHRGSNRRILDVFLIDSGWNNEVGKAVRENLPIFANYLEGQRFFVLNETQSLTYIKRHPSLVGADPVLIVLDRKAVKERSPKGFGFRLCLGHMRNPDAAISMMKWAIQLSMASNGDQMATLVRESGHRQTIQGTIELIGEGSAHLLEFAPV
ncbi:hypothetical protein [Schlesneria sp. DSM 10557]|uniref:hypothetical protein n=2 Tax=unclassified Schlesneria TaxID=2762017 RepID=UPI0035A1B546